jgi:hypothetical protein
MGRRQKLGFQLQSYTAVRIKPLQNLVHLHDQIAETFPFQEGKKRSELFKELVKRRKKHCPHCLSIIHDEPAYLICHHLNSDDVMKVLGCNRRTALDYLQALRDIVGFYKKI